MNLTDEKTEDIVDMDEVSKTEAETEDIIEEDDDDNDDDVDDDDEPSSDSE